MHWLFLILQLMDYPAIHLQKPVSILFQRQLTCLVLPNDIFTRIDDGFFSVVKLVAGDSLYQILRIQLINSARKLLNTADVFAFFQIDSEETDIIKPAIKEAKQLFNTELTGKADPYARVRTGNIVAAKTRVIESELNPNWDEVVYVPVHRAAQVLFLDVMVC